MIIRCFYTTPRTALFHGDVAWALIGMQEFISLTYIIRFSDDKFWSKLLVDDQISSLRCDLWAYDVFLFRFDMNFPLTWVAGVVECGGG